MRKVSASLQQKYESNNKITRANVLRLLQEEQSLNTHYSSVRGKSRSVHPKKYKIIGRLLHDE